MENKFKEFYQDNILSRFDYAKFFMESLFVKLYLLFGYRRDVSVIPIGDYCYSYDEEKNKVETFETGYSKIGLTRSDCEKIIEILKQ